MKCGVVLTEFSFNTGIFCLVFEVTATSSSNKYLGNPKREKCCHWTVYRWPKSYQRAIAENCHSLREKTPCNILYGIKSGNGNFWRDFCQILPRERRRNQRCSYPALLNRRALKIHRCIHDWRISNTIRSYSFVWAEKESFELTSLVQTSVNGRDNFFKFAILRW